MLPASSLPPKQEKDESEVGQPEPTTITYKIIDHVHASRRHLSGDYRVYTIGIRSASGSCIIGADAAPQLQHAERRRCVHEISLRVHPIIKSSDQLQYTHE
jgi:hypothetical protein